MDVDHGKDNNFSDRFTPLPPPPPPQSVASTSGGTGDRGIDRQHLQALIEGTKESWNYVIFWQSSWDRWGSNVLAFGNGYYKGQKEERKGKANATSSPNQEHSKKVFRELSSLGSGPSSSATAYDDDYDAMVEDVTDMEWFFLISKTQSFVKDADGLPALAFFNSTPVWFNGAEVSAAADHRHEEVHGLQTLVCIPSANGLVELGSTELIYPNSDLMNKVKVLLQFRVPTEYDHRRSHHAESWRLNETHEFIFPVRAGCKLRSYLLQQIPRRIKLMERVVPLPHIKLKEATEIVDAHCGFSRCWGG